MSAYEDSWLHAVIVLSGGAEPRVSNPKETVPALEEWGKSSEGLAALTLLKAADREICVGYSEEVMCMTTALVLKPEGMCSHRGKVGLSQPFAPEEPESELVSPEEATKMAISYSEEIGSEEDLVIFLRNELNEIAQEVNKKALAAQAA